MTGIDQIGSESVTLQGYEGMAQDVKEERLPEVYDQEVGATLERMQEEEALQRAIMPHLRLEEPREAAFKRIETILEEIDGGWWADEMLLESIQILAPVDPAFAYQWAQKIQNNDLKSDALVTIAKHQEDEEAQSTLLEAETLCSLDNFARVTQMIDEGKRRGFPQAERLIAWVIDRQSRKFYHSIDDLELMHYFKVPGFEKALMTFHNTQSYLPFEERVRLLQLEMTVDSPLQHETLKQLRGELQTDYYWYGRSRFELLLPIEGSHPAFRKEYLEDLELLRNKLPTYFNYCWGDQMGYFTRMLDQAPLSFLEEILELENWRGHLKPYVFLEVLKRRSGEEGFSLQHELPKLHELLSEHWYEEEDYVDLFIPYAEVFGIEDTKFLLDRAIEEAYWIFGDFEDCLKADILEEKETVIHYGARLFGMESDYPKKEEDFPFTRFSKMDSYSRRAILKAFAAFSLPETRRLLDHIYRDAETEKWLYSHDGVTLIRAELALL